MCMIVHVKVYYCMIIIFNSSVPYHKLNIMIVGDPLTAKTSLIRKSSKKGNKHKHSSNQITLKTFEYSLSMNDRTVTFRVWDFPSQVCI